MLLNGRAPTADELRGAIERQAVQVMWLTAGLFNAIVDQDASALRGVEQLLIGGEALSVEHVNRAFTALPELMLINGYGPTEGTTFTCCYRIDPSASHEWRSVPIGQPIANSQAYILDQRLQPAPIGVVGELYIGGDGLARGYFNCPELTAERFAPDGLSGKGGERLYRTGDLARYLPNGNIEFIGRADQQVKLRGYRIELGEIEATLNQHPAVEKSVVEMREDRPGNKRLVGYLTVRAGQNLPNPGELRDYLSEHLPNYMAPAAYVQLDAFPLTPNGKLDRKALLAPDNSHPELDQPYDEPRTHTERLLAEIWATILRRDQVGIRDNFFQLGGDSILVIQVVAKAKRAGIYITPKAMFERQTIAELAAVASISPTVQAEQDVVRGSAPLTPIQHWFFNRNFTQPHHFNQSVMLELSPSFGVTLLQQALNHLLKHHDALRLRFVQDASVWRQINAEREESEIFFLIDLSRLSEQNQEVALTNAAAETQASLNLAHGPIMRCVVFDLGVGRPKRLLIVVHHLAIDGVSWRILLDDLQTAYQQLCRREAIRLEPKTTSYKRWAEKLTAYAKSEDLQEELSYWLSQPWAKVRRLPVDKNDGANLEETARSVTVTLSTAETIALLQRAQAVLRSQINDLLLVALAQAFASWSGDRVLLLDLEGHGRVDIIDDVDLTRTMGWFTTIFPLILDLTEAVETEEVLAVVKRRLREIPRQGAGYGFLRYLSQGAAEQLQKLPQAEVSFNYLGQLDQIWQAARSEAGSRPFATARGSGGPHCNLKEKRSHLLDITGSVRGGRLRLTWIYSENVHLRSQIEALAQGCLSALRALIGSCQTATHEGYKPGDFPLAKLEQTQLDQLIALYPQVEDIYPASPMQQCMISHTLHDPGGGEWLVQFNCWLWGALNTEAFEQAWQQILDRHQVLRTSFHWSDSNEALQILQKQVKIRMENFDWSDISEDERKTKLHELLQADRKRGFDLTTAPLMRLILVRLGEAAYNFIWSVHHALVDGWSVQLLIKELFENYHAFCLGRQPVLQHGPPYKDYIAWLRRQDLGPAREFWRRHLQGVRFPTPLFDGGVETAADPDEKYKEEVRLLSATATEQLKLFARRRHLTLNTLVQGAWALLLSRYSNESAVVFGTVVSGRPPHLDKVESTVGPFINVLPLRVVVRPGDSVLAWLNKLQDCQVEMRQYEYSPLAQVQWWGEIPRETPLFESILLFQNYPTAILGSRHNERDGRDGGAALNVGRYEAIEWTGYPLTVRAKPGPRLQLQVIYSCHRFSQATIIRTLDCLETLLSGLAADPHRSLSELTLRAAAD